MSDQSAYHVQLLLESIRVLALHLKIIRPDADVPGPLALMLLQDIAHQSDAAQEEIVRLRTENANLHQHQMVEADMVKCLEQASCLGTIKMSFDSGPYNITRPSLNATKLIRAVEEHHGIFVR